jgi:hypothetical protein
MSKTIKIKVYSDPGHAWGAVKRELLDQLNITNQITTYSYQKGKTVYLEEDLDLGTLITSLNNNNIGFTVVEKNSAHRYSPIRSYEHFKA